MSRLRQCLGNVLSISTVDVHKSQLCLPAPWPHMRQDLAFGGEFEGGGGGEGDRTHEFVEGQRRGMGH